MKIKYSQKTSNKIAIETETPTAFMGRRGERIPEDSESNPVSTEFTHTSVTAM